MSQKTKSILDCVKGISFGASLTGVGIFLFNSCGPKPTLPSDISSLIDPLLNNGIAVSTEGTVTNTSFYIALVPTFPGTYKIHATDTSLVDPTFGSFSKPCQVLETSAATSTDSDIMCIVESQELDLFFNGMQLNYNIPPTMCSYFMITPYYYYVAQPGKGPTATSYTVQLDGTVATPSPTLPVDADGKPSCNYNYTTNAGKKVNCCEGTYVTTVSTVQPAPSPAIVSTINGDWGGKASNCLAGPGVDFGTKDTYGVPKSKIYLVDGMGANDTLKIAAPIGKDLKSNIYVANYFNPVPLLPNTRPIAMSSQTGGFGQTNPYYEFACLDRAFENRARIRVQIREWNEVSEFAKGDEGNPDTGLHGIIYDGENFNFSSVEFTPEFGGTTPKNRFLDWDDLEFFSTPIPAAPATSLRPYFPGAAYPLYNE